MGTSVIIHDSRPSRKIENHEAWQGKRESKVTFMYLNDRTILGDLVTYGVMFTSI